MKWPDTIGLFVNDEGPPVDIWHTGGPGGPFLTADSMETAQAIIGAIDELHERRAEVEYLRRRYETPYDPDLTDLLLSFAHAAQNRDLDTALRLHPQILTRLEPDDPRLQTVTQLREMLDGPSEIEKARAEVAALHCPDAVPHLSSDLQRDVEEMLTRINTQQGRIESLLAESRALLNAREDLRLSLAAERSDPDAGKDLGYEFVNGVYLRRVEGGHIEVELYDDNERGRWRGYRFARGEVVPPWRQVWGETAREVMRKANGMEGQ